MLIKMSPIGYVRHLEKNTAVKVPRHWSISTMEGRLEIDPQYIKGLKDIQPGQSIVVLFYFHKSPAFTADHLIQTPPHHGRPMGLFSICSPIRPNPIGLSVLEVLEISGGNIRVKGIDMLDGTPILDIKPHVKKE